MKPWYLCAVFADGGRVAFNKSRESGRKDKSGRQQYGRKAKLTEKQRQSKSKSG